MASSFSYPCLRDLYKSLGRFDAICGYAIVAVDFYTEEYEQHPDGFDWITRYSKGQGVTLHDVHFESINPRLAEMFVLLVHAQFEEFIHSFLLEHKASREWGDSGDQGLFEYVLKNLGLTHATASAAERETIKYYHLARNVISHPSIKRKRMENQLTKLREILNVTDEHLPPKPLGKFDYGDFDLFTRAVKAYAAKICETARPSDADLARLIVPEIKRLNRFKTKPTRFRNAVRQVLHMKYHLTAEESDGIIEHLEGVSLSEERRFQSGKPAEWLP